MPETVTKNVPENAGEFRKLAFFRTFITATGDTLETIASIAGVSKVQVGNWFRNDNMGLEQLHTVIGHYGYVLEIALTRMGGAVEAPREIYPKDLKQSSGRITVKRLAFLSAALRELNITQVELGKRMGLSKFAISAWFKTDNISIGKVYAVAEACGLNVFITVRPGAEPVQPAIGERKSETCIILKETRIIPDGAGGK